jgi:diamine N-acetyltransferase
MIALEPLNRFNWETVLSLKVDSSQEDFLPNNLYIIAETSFEHADRFIITHDQVPVGLIIICWWSGIPWITRVMIDEQHQGKGYGSKAISEALRWIRLRRRDVYEVRTTVSMKNAMAEYVFATLGFERMEVLDPKELVLQLVFKEDK